MIGRAFRRLVPALLSLLLVLGFMAQGGQTAAMSAAMAVSAPDHMDMAGCCDGCSGQEDVSADGCAAHCVGTPLLPVGESAIVVAPARAAFCSALPRLRGHHSAPEPHPPRPSFTS